MQFNVQTPVLSIGWSNSSSRALKAVASASNGWLAAITVDSELLTVAPSGSTTTSKGSGDTLCFSDSADNVVCAGRSAIDVYSVPEGRSVATLSEERAPDAPDTGAGTGPCSRAPTVAKHPSQNTFAVATGRREPDVIVAHKGVSEAIAGGSDWVPSQRSFTANWVVRLLGLDAKVKADIGPLKSEVQGLEWASDGRLYIQLSRHILVASADGETVRTVQKIQEDGTIIAMAISPSASHLAASIHTPGDNQVDIHLLQKELASDKEALSTNLTSFHQYDDKISCLAWDHSGRFLATGDCGEATIWDVDLVKAGGVVQNVICCGHCQNSSVQRMAFSPNDSILATAGTDGQVLLFDSSLFQEGTLLSPIAKIQAAPAGSQMLHLAWTTDSSLFMATSSGIVASFQLAGCKPAGEGHENAAAAPIIPATPTRMAHNAPMERASSYSTGGSGANSDNEAVNASLQNSTRLEITTQVAKEGSAPLELPKLEVKTKVLPLAESHEDVPAAREGASANSKLSAESPEYTPTAAVDRTVPQIDNHHCNGTIEEEPEPPVVHSQDSSSSVDDTPEPSQLQPATQKASPAQPAQPTANPRPIVRNTVRAAVAPAANHMPSGRGNAPQFRRPANGSMFQKHQEEYMDRSHSFPQRAASIPRGSARPVNGSEGAPAATTPLSPGLLQRMQAIKENPQLGHHPPQRSQLAGWGPGPLQPMASLQHRPLHYKGMPMTHHMAPMAFAPGPPGIHAPHGFLHMMPQQPLPFTVAPGGTHPGPMHSGPPGTVQVVNSAGIPPGPPTGPPAFAAGFQPGAPGMVLGGMPQGQPYIMVPAGAQPPQGWVPVVPSSWMGMYGGNMIPPPGHTMPPHMPAMSNGHDFFPSAAPWPTRPGDDAGVEMSAQMRWRPAYRSLPASLGRTKLMPPMAPRPPGFAPPSHGLDSRPAPAREAAEESQGSNQASETGSITPAENQSTADSLGKAPAGGKPFISYAEHGPPGAFAYPAPGAMQASPTELLMTEGTADAPPQPVTTLYVGNLPPTVDEQILFQTFRPFGHIPDIQVIRDKITNHSRGFAFVTFAGPHAATCAHAQLNGATMYGPYSGRALRLGASNRTSATAEE